ncbi:recombination-associated protein RdgC [Bergeriella denitrificans]|uniref:Recombination-associated protein RdgC n=1 Tax=Bergeriella denitrificans TaxID=494 RepID=A0A378UG69_BERDE|nr:recombination-associated protein RdgC [Bergeriella denitrificans]STZ76316.1 recombination-associated protein rdgC [Bergeriella denitrificans]
MWFKQLTPFRLLEMPEERQLDEALGSCRFTPPPGLSWFSEGFDTPVPFDYDRAVFEADGSLLVSLKREEKILPGAAINQILAEKTAKIQAEEGRNIGRREKQELREAIIDDLLPKALTQSSRTYGLLAQGWLWVDTASPHKAENLLSHLRLALGGMNALYPRTVQAPGNLMTEWLLRGECGGGFELDCDCTLIGVGDVAPKVKISRKDLTDDDVVRHVKNGMLVAELGLVWQERIAFILTGELTLKRIRWLDVLQEQAADGADDIPTRTYAEQVIMTAALSEMLGELVGLLGGWQD